MTPARRPRAGTRALVTILALFLAAALLEAQATGAAKEDPLARFQGARIGSITVQFHDFNRHESMRDWTVMVRNVIHLNEGEIFTAGLLDESKKALALMNRFSDIRADARLEGSALAVDFQLTPYRFIRNIVIRGNAEILETEIAAVMSIHAGAIYKPEQLPMQEQLVRDKYLAEGYIDPIVTARSERSARDGNYTVYITIRPGAYYSYGDISIRGNRAMPDIEIRLRLFSETFRFIESEFMKNITAIKKRYWELGYPEAQVRYTLNRDRARGVANMDIIVHEGPKYRIRFSGNRRFWDITLKKSLVLSRQGNAGEAGARKSAQNIAALYRAKGYPDARVRPDMKLSREGGKERKALTFVIDEGPRVEVSNVRITGNASFSGKKILAMMATQASGSVIKRTYNADVLDNDLLVIRSFYARQGFMDAKVESGVTMEKDRTRASILISVIEGTATRIASIEFSGNHVLTGDQLRKKISIAPGRPFQESDVTAAENVISSLISEKGYPYATVKGSASISDDRTGAAVMFRITEGKQVRLGSISFSGNMRTRTSYLGSQLSLKTGDPFSIRKVLEEYKNISDIDIFQTVNMNTLGIEEKKERADLFIDVVEKNPLVFGIGGGYNSKKGVFAKTSLEDRNFLGRYKSLWVKGEAAETGYSGSVGFTEPRLIGSKASLTAGFSIDRLQEFNQTFGTFVYGPSCSIKSVWFDSLTAGLSASYQERKMTGHLSLKDLENLDTVNQFHLRRILLFTAALSYDRRDSFIRPRKGFITSATVDVSVDLSRSRQDMLGVRYSDNFIRYHYSLKFYFTPWERLTFAAQAMLGYIQPYTSVKTVFNDQLYYLGGIGDVRGFKENMLKYNLLHKAVGGRAQLAGSIEARIDLGFNFELCGFLDAGRIDNTFYDWYRLRLSAGPGLRYVTPLGPVGLLYGFKINRRKGEDLGVLQISIGYTF